MPQRPDGALDGARLTCRCRCRRRRLARFSPVCRYGAHTADWVPELGLYAYAAQNTIVVLNTRGRAVRTLLSGHTNRWAAGLQRWAAAAGLLLATLERQAAHTGGTGMLALDAFCRCCY